MKALTVTERVERYCTWVQIAREDEPFEYAVFEALLLRSKIEREREALTKEQQEAVEKADDLLVEIHDRVAEALDTFIEERDSEATHWWWHLDEGPQAREEAGKKMIVS